MDVDDERSVAAAAAAGNAAAFEQLVRLTQVDVMRACRAFGGGADAEDLTQETYLRAYRALPSYTGGSSVRTWLVGIARHVCLDHTRRAARRRVLARRVPPPPVSSQPMVATELDLLIRALPTPQRDAFVLTQLVGLSYDEAANLLGCPVGTIRSRVARARATLLRDLDATARPA